MEATTASSYDLYNIGCLVEAGIHYYCACRQEHEVALRHGRRAANGMVAVMGPPPRKNIIPGHAAGKDHSSAFTNCSEEHVLSSRETWACGSTRRSYLRPRAAFGSMLEATTRADENFGEYGQDHLPVAGSASDHRRARRAIRFSPQASRRSVLRARWPVRPKRPSALCQNMVTPPAFTSTPAALARSRAGREVRRRLRPTERRGDYLETCARRRVRIPRLQPVPRHGRRREGRRVGTLSLYNGGSLGVSLKGDAYSYENPLDAGRNRAPRWSWHACPCCPPMFLKLMGKKRCRGTSTRRTPTACLRQPLHRVARADRS